MALQLKRHVDDGRFNPAPSKILGVFGMSHRTTDRDLNDLFGKYGKIDDIKIIKDHITNESRGFGFIYFADLGSATEARNRLNGEEIHGRQIRTDYSVTKQGHSSSGPYRGSRGSTRYREERDRRGGYERDYRDDRFGRNDRRERDYDRYDRRRSGRYYDRSRSR